MSDFSNAARVPQEVINKISDLNLAAESIPINPMDLARQNVAAERKMILGFKESVRTAARDFREMGYTAQADGIEYNWRTLTKEVKG